MLNKVKRSNIFIGFLDLILIAFLIFDFGFINYQEFKTYKLIALPVIMLTLIAFNFYKFWKFRYNPAVRRSTRINLIILSVLVIIEILSISIHFRGSLAETFFADRGVVEYGLLVYYFIRFTFLMRRVYSLYFNPAILFVGSFALIALAGTFLLMLPSATTHSISFTNALFTSTSAVSVTGLIVLDTAKDFTPFGQTIIMVLFQIGGLGMLTFTSFFAYFFKSGASFKESLFVKDMLGGDQLSNAMQTTMRIVVFSLIVEAVGAILIYNSIDKVEIENHGFFAVFHAISAYCNAGFSLSSDSLHAPGLRFNYYLQWVIMGLIVFGGLGYAIAYNFIQYIRQFFINLFQKRKKKFISRLIKLNTKIVIYTTLILIVAGTVFFLFSEQNASLLAHHTFFGKLTTSMFSSVTARTAGFNTVDYSSFTMAGLLFMILLMWIGASPASTGGGIKTSTFAIATLNIFSIARDKPNIEIGTRRVASDAVRRAFAIMTISLITIGISILLLLIFDPQVSLLQAAFEIFSAFSTVGLSMGITPNLSEAGKYVIIFTMFFGRIGLINLMIGILKNVNTREYKYPKENILIN